MCWALGSRWEEEEILEKNESLGEGRGMRSRIWTKGMGMCTAVNGAGEEGHRSKDSAQNFTK